MRPFVLIICLVLLTACSHRPPPTCDGSDKRPLNAGKWNEVMGFGACAPRDGAQ